MPRKARGTEPETPVEEIPVEAEQELELADIDERLPWLESDDDDERPGVDTGRLVALAAVGLLAIVLTVGALWLFTRDTTDEALVADGSTIEAPEEPYRTRPDDPGGREVEGTGDTSFEVAEGREVEGRIAGSGDVPVPSIDREQASHEQSARDTKPATSVVGVQVAAYSSRAAAETGWGTLTGRLQALQGRNHRVVQGVVDSGTVYRLQALAATAAEAEALCRSIKAEGGDCQVKR